MSALYLMTGPSGAGKTYFAKAFAKEKGLQYLCIDDFYALFNGDERLHEDEFEVWMSFFKAIHLAELHGRSVMIDTNSPRMTERAEFIDLFYGFNEHHLICILADRELCRKNNSSRRRVIPDDEFDAIYDSIEIPKPNEYRWDSVKYYENKNNDGFVWRNDIGGGSNV